MAAKQLKYESREPLRVVKELVFTSSMKHDGTLSRVNGDWASKPGNIIEFAPGKPVVLTDEDMKIPHIKQLIENGTLRRVF